MSFTLEDDYGDYLGDINGGMCMDLRRRAVIYQLETVVRFLDNGRAEPEEMEQLIAECKSVDDDTLQQLASTLQDIPSDSGVTITQ